MCRPTPRSMLRRSPKTKASCKIREAVAVAFGWSLRANALASMACPAKANPSARSEQANQVCKQIWNAAIGVEPSRATIEADSVTQHVVAITRASNRKPFLRNQPNCRCLKLGGNKSTCSLNLHKSMDVMKYLQNVPPYM